MRTYIKLAIISLKKNPFFSFVTLFGISLTITALMVIGSIIDSSYGTHGLEKRMDHLLISKMMVVERENKYYSSSGYSFNVYDQYFSKMKTPDMMAVCSGLMNTNLYYKHVSEMIERRDVSQSYMEMFDFEYVNGKPFSEDDFKQRSKVALITDKLAADVFGAEDCIGKKIKVNSELLTVRGVIKQGNRLRNYSYADVYAPIDESSAWYLNQYNKKLGNLRILMYFNDTGMVESGRKEFDKVMASIPLDKEKKEVKLSGEALRHIEMPVYDLFDLTSATALYGIVILIVLLCMFLPALNLVNINITRMLERSGEIGIRKAFGASAGELIRQFLVENTVITIIGGLIGFVIATITIHGINYFGMFNANETLEVNPILFVYGFTVMLIFSVMSGTYPAIRMSRFEIVKSLKSENQ
ncbi:FtsX-like permease family protein [Limibacter armeniacum]|uniref:ABC transporter permease n=1 Tax=Limibacter armeniacum TaxID=466084 RepID=UPI002FE61172